MYSLWGTENSLCHWSRGIGAIIYWWVEVSSYFSYQDIFSGSYFMVFINILQIKICTLENETYLISQVLIRQQKHRSSCKNLSFAQIYPVKSNRNSCCTWQNKWDKEESKPYASHGHGQQSYPKYVLILTPNHPLAESLVIPYASMVGHDFLKKPEDDFMDLKARPFFSSYTEQPNKQCCLSVCLLMYSQM